MEFFLTVMLIYPPDDRPKAFYYQTNSFGECQEMRKNFVDISAEGLPWRVASAICASGKAPPPSEFQRKALDKALEKALESLNERR